MKKKERKCIAVILEKPTKRYQSDLLKGIYEAAFSSDMNVAVFGTSVIKMSDNYCVGETNIFNLINYKKIAGVIYLRDTLRFSNRDEIVTKPLLKAHKKLGIPVVTIDDEVEGIPAFLGDDSRVVANMVEHLIVKHGCRDIAYMTGTKGHFHAERRLQVFRDVMARYNLPVDESRVYYGDFWYDEGENFANRLLSSEKGLPEAIVCANSPMAQSVYRALFDRGIRIPRDVRLVGYEDDLDRPSFISSGVRHSQSVGKAACEGLIAMINDGAQPLERQFVACDCEENHSITCGCTPAEHHDLLSINGIRKDNADDYFSEYNCIRGAMIASPDYTSMLWTLDYYTYFLKDFASLHICMCDGWDNPAQSVDESNIQRKYTPEMVINYMRINHPDGTNDRYVGSEKRFSTKEMFPLLFSAEGKPSAYIFRSLHFEDRCFGYSVFSYADRIEVPSELYDFWINDLSDVLESQRRLQNMRWLYSEMQRNAVTDLMTGLLNRNGFNLMLPQLINEAKQQNAQVLLVMGDLNGLKYINDTFGHAEGDESIKTAAGAISRTWIGGAVCEKNFRIGGDEFVKAAYGTFTKEQLDEFQKALTEFLANYNRTSNKPYPVHISIGFSLSGAEEDTSADVLLFDADKKMYADKLRTKKETGFDPKRG